MFTSAIDRSTAIQGGLGTELGFAPFHLELRKSNISGGRGRATSMTFPKGAGADIRGNFRVFAGPQGGEPVLQTMVNFASGSTSFCPGRDFNLVVHFRAAPSHDKCECASEKKKKLRNDVTLTCRVTMPEQGQPGRVSVLGASSHRDMPDGKVYAYTFDAEHGFAPKVKGEIFGFDFT
jgi:hypothetical protein